MKLSLKKFLSITIASILFFNIIFGILLSFGINNVYAEGLKIVENGNTAAEAAYPPGTAIRGVPGLEAVPATQEDIDYINSPKADAFEANILPELNSTKTFISSNMSVAGGYYNVTADLKRIGAHSYIYQEQNPDNVVTDEMLDKIVQEFELIYSRNIAAFGNPPDIDRDKRINILLMDINDISGDGSYIAGYFNSYNELPKATYPVESNECEVFYMDINEGLPSTVDEQRNFFGTLAHEFQHMIQYNVYLSNYTSINTYEEIWLNESMSCLAEYINGYGHPVAQIEFLLADDFSANTGLIEWDSTLGNYGASYIFGLYMYEQLGTDFIKHLVQNPLSGIDSINDQLKKDSKATTFDVLFEKSQVALSIDNGTASPGEYGFNTIDISNIRLDPAYISIPFYSMSTLSDDYPSTVVLDTDSGGYRSLFGFIDGTRTTGAVKMMFSNANGEYYIVKPSDSSVVSTFAEFLAVDKTIEKIQPDTVNGNTIKLNTNQWAQLIYIAKGVPINNSLTISEAAAPAEDLKPTQPTGLSCIPGYNSVTASWTPSTYTKGIKGYNIYRNSVKVNSIPVLASTYFDTGLIPSRAYSYQVEAVGLDNILSTKSTAFPVTTLAAPDLTPPSPPTISYVSTGDGYVDLKVTDGVNNPAEINHYEVIGFLDGMDDQTVYTLTQNDLGVTARLNGFTTGVLYNFYALSVDNAGNYSAQSNRVNVKIGTESVTLPTLPTKPGNVHTTSVQDHNITLAWNASTATGGILEYNIYRNGVYLNKTSSTSYNDTGLTAGTSYAYTIEAVGNDVQIGNKTYNLNSVLSDVLSTATLAAILPTAAITYSDVDGRVKQGDSLTITATFSEPMADSPIPQIALSGGNTVAWTEMTKVNSTTYKYDHSVVAGDGTTTVELRNAKDLFGFDVVSTPTSGSTFIVDNTAPSASISYSDTDGRVKQGDSLTITATFSETMAVNPIPQIALSGGNTVAATAMTKVTATTYTYTYTVGAGNGITTVALSNGKDLIGFDVVSAPTSGSTFTVDNIAPTASISYSDADRIVKAGTSLTITATFNEDMAISPVPKISISGVNTLSAVNMTRTDATHYRYIYTVGAGNGTETIALSIGKDLVGNLVTAAPTSGATFTIDNMAPTAAISYNDADGKVKSGDTLIITATFNEAMAGAPIPKIAISGGDTVTATDMAFSDSTHYTYTYTVGGTNGVATVALSTGTDLAGNVITAAPTSGATFTVDNTAPTAAITYSDADGIVKAGDSLTITATFNEAVKDAPIPKISISGANTVAAADMIKTDPTHYYYTYTVVAGNGICNVTLANGTDLMGNLITTTPSSGGSFTVDSTSPTTAITYSDTDGIVKAGTSLTITATFSESMAASPVPTISITGAGNDKTATAMTKVNATKYTYNYTVLSGNGTATVSLGTGKDIAGNVVTAAPTSGATFTVDSTAPTAAISYSDADGIVKAGTELIITANFSENMADSTVPKITISGGGNNLSAIAMTKASATQYTYTYTVISGNGTATVSLSAGTDIAGNVITAAPTSGATFTVDNTGPTAAISYSDADGIVMVGDSLTITAAFNEDLVGPLPKISVSGANTVAATNMTEIDARHFTYNYTVGSGNGTATVSLSTGMDVAGNIVASVPSSGATFVVDSIYPVAAITYDDADGIVKPGSTLVITATFTKAMDAGNPPEITLTGANTLASTPMNWINSTTYRYSYNTVGANDGIVTVSMSAGKDIAGHLVIAAPSSGATFTVDGTAPTAAITYSDADAKVKAGTVLTITANFSEGMATSPLPKIIIAGAGNDLAAVNMTRVNATQYTYNYTVKSGNGAATVSLSTGTDIAGNVITSLPTSGGTFTVDSTSPTAAISYNDPDGIVKAGYSLIITATFSEAMTEGPAPKIAISGANTVDAANMTKTDSTHYTYAYTVGAGNGTATVRLSIGTDIAGNMIVTIPTSGPTFTVDNTSPAASITYSDADKLVKEGDSLTITATFNEAVADAPIPKISVSGANTVAAVNMIKTDSTHYYYTHTVGSGNDICTVALSTGTDIAGNLIASAPTSGSTFTVDSTAPTAAITYSDGDKLVKAGDSLKITATFSEVMVDSPKPKISISGGNTVAAVDMVKTDTTHYYYTYTVGAGDGAAAVSLSTGTDRAGNPITTVPTSGVTFTVDNTAPVNAGSYPSAGVITGSTAQILIKTNETGKAYYVCLADGADAPSSLQVQAGKDMLDAVLPSNMKGEYVITADVEAEAIAKGLVGSTNYDIYVVAVDNMGNLQSSPVKLDISTLVDITAPVNAATFPKAGTLTSNSASVILNTDEYGKIYYLCLADGAAAPSAAQVKAGKDSLDVDAAAGFKGVNNMIGGSENTFTIAGLASSTDYDIYLIAEDVSGNLQASAAKVDVKTTAQAIFGGGFIPSPEEVKDSIIQVPTSGGENGAATGEVDAADLDKAFEQARSDADGNKKVTIELEKVTGADEYTTQLPVSFVSSESSNNTINIKSPLGDIAIPSNMFDSEDLANGTEVGITIGTADTSALSEDIRNRIGNKPVIELKATVDGKPVSWNSDDSEVAVTIDYAPSAEELKDPEHIVVWYIDGSGKAVSVPNGRYNADTGKVTFTTNHFSKYAVVYFKKTFNDILSSYAKDKIEVMASKGIISGTSDSTYSPDSQISRADFLVLLMKVTGLKASFDKNFSDVKTTDYYYNALGIAKKLGITSGTGNNLFMPNAKISRQEMAALTFRALMVVSENDFKPGDSLPPKFADAKSIASYAKVSVAVLVNKKIINRSTDKFDPKELVTRAEMADIIYNIYNVIYK